MTSAVLFVVISSCFLILLYKLLRISMFFEHLVVVFCIGGAEVDMDMEDGDSAAEPSTSDQGNTENVVLAATYITFDDPVRDLEVISQELRLKDIEFMEKRIEELEKSMKRSNGKQLKIEHELCLKVCFLLDWNDFFFFLNFLYILVHRINVF
nr:obg-like ATPase 1 [Ipomoea batatas]